MLLDIFHKSVADNPNRIAIEFEQHKITYTELNRIINRLANALITLGVNKGDRVILLLPNVPHFVFAYYAILKAKAIVVPINFLVAQQELEQIIDETQAKTIIFWDGIYARLCQIKELRNLIVLGQVNSPNVISLTKLIASSSDVELSETIGSEDTVLIYYTSGVVDAPKPVELSYQNLSKTVFESTQFLSIERSDIFAALLPLFLLVSQHMIMHPALIHGAKLILYPKFNSQLIDQAIHRDKTTVLVGTPNIFNSLNRITNSIPHELRYVLSFGTACFEAIQKNFEQNFNLPLLEGYGIAEASGIVSLNRNRSTKKSGSVGQPIDGIEVRIIDENGDDVKIGEIGEIVLKGKNIMKGYWNHPEKTAQVLKNGWFFTGDLGKMDEDGYLFYIGRKADVIVKGGFLIYPGEIEQVLLTHPQIDEVAVVAVPHPDHKHEVKACIVLKPGQDTTAEDVINYCKEYMPVYKCPQIVHFFTSLPKTTTGKIITRKLRESV